MSFEGLPLGEKKCVVYSNCIENVLKKHKGDLFNYFDFVFYLNVNLNLILRISILLSAPFHRFAVAAFSKNVL